MGKNRNNIVTKGFSGAIGDDIVFRQTGQTQVVAKLPVKSNKPHLIRKVFEKAFKKATFYANAVMANPELKELYTLLAKRKGKSLRHAYNLALRDARKAPEVDAIITSKYEGQPGNEIRIDAVDDFKVVSVRVAIYSPGGELIERGNAILPPLSMEWVYTATVANAQLAGSKIIATAVDMPGNETSAEIILS